MWMNSGFSQIVSTDLSHPISSPVSVLIGTHREEQETDYEIRVGYSFYPPEGCYQEDKPHKNCSFNRIMYGIIFSSHAHVMLSVVLNFWEEINGTWLIFFFHFYDHNSRVKIRKNDLFNIKEIKILIILFILSKK